jgi:hypothetical protein
MKFPPSRRVVCLDFQASRFDMGSGGPADMPAPVVQKINAEVTAMFNMSDVKNASSTR